MARKRAASSLGFDLDGFIASSSDRLAEKHRRPPVDSFERAMAREVRDANARDRIDRVGRAPMRYVPEGEASSPVVLPPVRRTR